MSRNDLAFRPPLAETLLIPGPVGALEARREVPAADAGNACGVVCHPHPLHGGTLDNKVVHAAARAMQMRGAPTLRFNYRGVGASNGHYGEGLGEREDALAMVAAARATWPGRAVWLAGFSFGAVVALAIAERAQVARLVTIAPPVGRLMPMDLPRPPMPWLVVQGSADELVDAQAVGEWARRYTPPPELALMDGASHFFHGRIVQLRDLVSAFLARTVP
jgi:alpha/beta superfamily hydrolase